MNKHIVVFTGAGMSAESGIATFRDSGGLWEQHRIEDVATPQAWQRNRALVLDFYNQRRKQLLQVQPNAAHHALVKLETAYKVTVITQNVDDLHERAGSTHVVHLHGELRKARSTANPQLVYPIEGWEIRDGDKCELGSQLRPHIVWFGELVPMLDIAAEIAATAHIFIIIGSSLQVYPAAGLIHAAPYHCTKYYVDPNAVNIQNLENLTINKGKAATEVPPLVEKLLKL